MLKQLRARKHFTKPSVKRSEVLKAVYRPTSAPRHQA